MCTLIQTSDASWMLIIIIHFSWRCFFHMMVLKGKKMIYRDDVYDLLNSYKEVHDANVNISASVRLLKGKQHGQKTSSMTKATERDNIDLFHTHQKKFTHNRWYYCWCYLKNLLTALSCYQWAKMHKSRTLDSWTGGT